MAEPGQLKVKASKKKTFNAVYVNSFGKHVSGSVIEFAGKSPRQAEKRRAVARTPAAVRSPGGSAGADVKPPLKTAVKNRSRSTLASFKPPAPVKSPVLSPGQADAGNQMQNSGLSTKNGATISTAGKADIFKFPVSVNSDATNGTKKKNNATFGKKREVFRVIYKMLHENENLRTRLLNTSHNCTVADVPTITNNEDSPAALITAFELSQLKGNGEQDANFRV